MDALDCAWCPTARALRLMNEDDEPGEVEDAGYVFVDGYSLGVWPRVYRGGLPIVEADFDHARVKIQRGTAGRPETVLANVIWPGQERAPTFRVRTRCRRQLGITLVAFEPFDASHRAFGMATKRAMD